MENLAKISAAKQHIEEIRRTRFGIGAPEPSPEAKVIFLAAEQLADELGLHGLYFVADLLQNAEENEYSSDEIPSLEFIVTSSDITSTGAPETLLVFNNEVGFSKRDIEAVCSAGQSTKNGRRREGLIGERGVGFKALFLITEQPYIFSNGYQIRFCETPYQNCRIRVVPEWVDSNAIHFGIQHEYNLRKHLPQTIFVLPLRSDKVEYVRKELAQLNSECLLFFSKVAQISVQLKKGSSCSPEPPYVKTIFRETSKPLTEETNVESFSVILHVQNDTGDSRFCKYYLCRENFPGKSRDEANRGEVMEGRAVTIAFPLGERLDDNNVGIFSYFPTATVTNFRFMIQSDFILSPFREMDFHDPNNMEILDCVPTAFASALMSLINTPDADPLDAASCAFRYLPSRVCSMGASGDTSALIVLADSIRKKVRTLSMIPYETFTEDAISYARPTDVRRVLPDFRMLLLCLKQQGACLKKIQLGNKFILHAAFDHEWYSPCLNFLGVETAESDPDWYWKYIQKCNLLSQLSWDGYLDLLCLLADNWKILGSSCVADAPMLTYLPSDSVNPCSFTSSKNKELKLCFALSSREHAWLNVWHKRFSCPNDLFLFPNGMLEALMSHYRRYFLFAWLQTEAKVFSITVYDYSSLLMQHLREDKHYDAVILLPHFLHESLMNNFINEAEVRYLFQQMPIVDGSGLVRAKRTRTLVPAEGSKWAKLFGFNPYTEEKYIELGPDYERISGSQSFLSYLSKYTGAVDLPDLYPPNVVLLIADLTAEQAFILLDWLSCLRKKDDARLPDRFIGSIKSGKWLKTASGFRSPTHCFLSGLKRNYGASEREVEFAGFSPVDEQFYGNKINSYMDELKMIGVKCVRFVKT